MALLWNKDSPWLATRHGRSPKGLQRFDLLFCGSNFFRILLRAVAVENGGPRVGKGEVVTKLCAANQRVKWVKEISKRRQPPQTTSPTCSRFVSQLSPCSSFSLRLSFLFYLFIYLFFFLFKSIRHQKPIESSIFRRKKGN